MRDRSIANGLWQHLFPADGLEAAALLLCRLTHAHPASAIRNGLGSEVIPLVAQVRFLPVFDVAESVSCL
jgi:hypothetical protein